MRIGSHVQIRSTYTFFLQETVGMYGEIVGNLGGDFLVEFPEEINGERTWAYRPSELKEVTAEESARAQAGLKKS